MRLYGLDGLCRLVSVQVSFTGSPGTDTWVFNLMGWEMVEGVRQGRGARHPGTTAVVIVSPYVLLLFSCRGLCRISTSSS